MHSSQKMSTPSSSSTSSNNVRGSWTLCFLSFTLGLSPQYLFCEKNKWNQVFKGTWFHVNCVCTRFWILSIRFLFSGFLRFSFLDRSIFNRTHVWYRQSAIMIHTLPLKVNSVGPLYYFFVHPFYLWKYFYKLFYEFFL